MKHRFFVEGPLVIGAVAALGDEERHHARVLRVREGEEVEVFDGRGGAFVAQYDSADSLRIVREAANREARTVIHLAMAIIQVDKFELVLQKATELGVHSIIPMITDRIEVRAERYRGKEDRWKKIVLEAVKQSGRSRIPTIDPPTKFGDVITRDGKKIVFHADAPPTTGQPESPTTLFIGPEGGWSEHELQIAHASGVAFERLGPRRLRAETAAIIGVALIAARSSDI